jgi:hypothetical protein
MLIDLEQICTATHKWEPMAKFRFAHMAVEAAELFSKLDKGTYRVLDRRFPDEGIEVTMIVNGRVMQEA